MQRTKDTVAVTWAGSPISSFTATAVECLEGRVGQQLGGHLMPSYTAQHSTCAR